MTHLIEFLFSLIASSARTRLSLQIEVAVLRHQLSLYQAKRRKPRIGSAWKRALKRAGIENFRFLDLRHTWASWHVMNGTGLQELMELGGWKSYEMVLRYAHLAPEHLSNAAARIERGLEIVTDEVTISLR